MSSLGEPGRRVVALRARVVAERQAAADQGRAVEPGRVRDRASCVSGKPVDGVPLRTIAAHLAVDRQVEVRGQVPPDARVRRRVEPRVARLPCRGRVGAEPEVPVEEVAPHPHRTFRVSACGVRRLSSYSNQSERLMVVLAESDEVPGAGAARGTGRSETVAGEVRRAVPAEAGRDDGADPSVLRPDMKTGMTP